MFVVSCLVVRFQTVAKPFGRSRQNPEVEKVKQMTPLLSSKKGTLRFELALNVAFGRHCHLFSISGSLKTLGCDTVNNAAVFATDTPTV